MTDLLQYLFNGLSTGGVYALVGLGVTLVYGLTRLVNFAHGEQLTLGALLGFSTAGATGNFFLGALAGGLAAGLMGLAMERGAFRFTRTRPVNGIILSIGLTLMLQAAYYRFWQDEVLSARHPFRGDWRLGSVVLGHQRLFVLAVTLALVAALFAFLKFHPQGRAVRAYSQDPEATLLMGVNADRLVTSVFVIGGFLAGIAGSLLLTMGPVDRFVGTTFAVKAFMVAIVGGLGRPSGALLAGLLIGITENLAGAYLSGGVSLIAGLAMAVAILMVRPEGLVRGEAGGHL